MSLSCLLREALRLRPLARGVGGQRAPRPGPSSRGAAAHQDDPWRLPSLRAFGAQLAELEQREAAQLCRCGHTRAEHEHYRHGTDCGHCDCSRFRPGRLRPV